MKYCEIEQKICENVKAIRLKRNKTQKEIAELLEISLSAYQKLEQGSRTFSTKQLYYLAKIYDINIDYFFSDAPKYWSCFSEEALINDSEHLTEKGKKELLLNVLSALDITVTPKDVSALVNWLRKYKFQYFYCSPLLKLYNMKRAELLNLIRTFDKSVIRFLPEDEKKLYVLQQEFEEIQKKIENAQNIHLELQKLEDIYYERVQKAKQEANKEKQEADERLFRKLTKNIERLTHDMELREMQLSSLEAKIETQNRIISQNEHIISSLGSPSNIGDTSTKYIELKVYEELAENYDSMQKELDIAYEDLDEAQEDNEYYEQEVAELKGQIKKMEQQIDELEQEQIFHKDEEILGGYTIVDINQMEMALWRYYKTFGPVHITKELRDFVASLNTLSDDIPDVIRYTKLIAEGANLANTPFG